MKFGLLIQGPLLSLGRTGNNVNSRLTDAALVNFDCRETILSNISTYGNLFKEIIVCTWEDGVFPDFALSKGKLLRIEDRTPQQHIGYRTEIYSKNKDMPNNMLRQFYGTHQGLLGFDDVDFVIKIRTDSSLDLKLFIDSVQDNDRINVPLFIREMNHIHDFYFAGRLNIMLDLFSILSQPDFITSSPHQDIILRYARARFVKEIGVDISWYNAEATAQRSKIFIYMLNNVFSALPRNLYETVVWRGDSFSDEYRQTFDGACFGYPDMYYQECSYPAIEEALFRTRKKKLSRLAQKIIRRSFFMVAKISNRYFE